MRSRAFADEPDPSDEAAASDTAEPEYTFEGYTVEFSGKVMLTPPSATPGARGNGEDKG